MQHAFSRESSLLFSHGLTTNCAGSVEDMQKEEKIEFLNDVYTAHSRRPFEN